jgi:hypothetical protein
VPEARDGVVLRVEITRVDGRLRLTPRARLLFTENDWLRERDAVPPLVAVRPLEHTAPEICAERLSSMRRALGPRLPILPDRCPPIPTR